MKNPHHPSHDYDSVPHGTISSYTLGFSYSIVFTLIAFWIAPHLGSFAYPAIIITALLQLLVQVIFFLHLGRDPKQQWNMIMFVFTGLIISILIIGTLWIMSNLEHLHMQSPTTTDIYEDGVVAPQRELH